ncbi:T9SS type A sorting domain-containing protein [Chryseobacterium joostei]|uniref:T9SS type A sorting domain-containing protein n=1 Tax=Chryseobacterium joostei TaxID=112234 RepID=UPI003D0AF256
MVEVQANYTTAVLSNIDAFQMDKQANVYHLESPTYPRKLKKITPNGGYDTNFGVNGVLTSSLSNTFNDYRADYLVTDSNIFFIKNNFVEKFDLSGNLDTSFGNNGILPLQIDKLAGYNGNFIFFNSGNIIKKFDKISGIVDPTFQIPLAKLIITDQNIMYTTSGNTVKKYNVSTGALDTTFGNQGVYTDTRSGNFIVDNGTSNLYFYFSYSGGKGINRFFSNGQLDSTFSVPQTELNLAIQSDDINSVSTDSAGRVLFFGGDLISKIGLIFRLLNNGTMDNTFNAGTFCYRKSDGFYLSEVRLVDDNTYIGTYRTRLGLSSSKYGNVKYVRTSSSLSTKEVNNTTVLIYPNPVKQYVNIKLKNNEKIVNLQVVSMMGKSQIVDNDNIKDNEVNLDFLPTGNYILNITTNKGTYTQKILKK